MEAGGNIVSAYDIPRRGISGGPTKALGLRQVDGRPVMSVWAADG